MRNVSLTVRDRLRLFRLVCQINRSGSMFRLSVDIDKLRKYQRLLDILVLTDEEKTLVGWKPSGEDDTGAGTWSKTEHEFEIPFEDADYDLLLKTVKDFTGWSPGEGHLVLPMMKRLQREEPG